MTWTAWQNGTMRRSSRDAADSDASPRLGPLTARQRNGSYFVVMNGGSLPKLPLQNPSKYQCGGLFVEPAVTIVPNVRALGNLTWRRSHRPYHILLPVP